MTNEEVIGNLENIIILSHQDGYTDTARKVLKLAIAALKAEPCEDAVSLGSVIDTIEWYRTNPQHFTEDNLIEDIKGLPPVTPKQRIGKWIPITNKNGTRIALRCDACGESPKHAIESDFCPNCGAKMEGESE